MVAVAALAAVLAALPLVASPAVLTWVFLVSLSVALGQSWNLLAGYAGQVNLGHAAFFGVGALATRALWVSGVPVPAALAGGCLAAAAAGALVALPSLRLRGPYFAIGTLAIAEILRVVAASAWPEVSALPAPLIASYRLLPRYYLGVGLAAAVTAVAWAVGRSRLGMGLAAVREDEDVAASVGVDPFRLKLAAVVLSAACAGAAGAVFGYYHPSFYPQFVFSPVWTFDSLVITYLGGVGTVAGPVVGAAFFVVVREALALSVTEAHLVVFGLLFILVVMAVPGGLMEIARLLRRRLARRALAPSPRALDRAPGQERG
ncbi:MAG: branched-chain amino acid ABC transporter permease [Armatimonadota bacterium]|nr:branched-chain amino acid ABC transporter permease [Armatimonadota bacterium]MDR7559652.1 branched-chain amino acid ABC transporter permease [Armatimonadota bacterium]MDR7577119.1 branched-chain amino acid ABC transporter permease [Armatimonadota bacterium]MDR7587228.1 branched-chain amino acid ABC transporter permease [Armatimonadota bacterium]MDR7611193.1 branched-chain amino acid ABC transporter permease [Armatimonadota bacterium]